MLFNVHDALVMQVPDDLEHIANAMKALDTAFRRPLVGRDGKVFYMKSEGKVGPAWGKSTMKDWKDN